MANVPIALAIAVLMFLRLYIMKRGIASNPNLTSKKPSAKAIPDKVGLAFVAKVEAEKKQES